MYNGDLNNELVQYLNGQTHLIIELSVHQITPESKRSCDYQDHSNYERLVCIQIMAWTMDKNFVNSNANFPINDLNIWPKADYSNDATNLYNHFKTGLPIFHYSDPHCKWSNLVKHHQILIDLKPFLVYSHTLCKFIIIFFFVKILLLVYNWRLHLLGRP